MRGMTDFDLCYNEIYFYMWEVTLGQAFNWKEGYRASKHYARFVLHELARKDELVANGETAIVRRGLIAADSIVKAWTFNVIEDCSTLRTPLPPEMLDVVYFLFGCSHQDEQSSNFSRNVAARRRFELLRKSQEDNLPTRATARELNVDPATIVRWKNESPDEDPGMPSRANYDKVAELTNISEWAHPGLKGLRR